MMILKIISFFFSIDHQSFSRNHCYSYLIGHGLLRHINYLKLKGTLPDDSLIQYMDF
jgi:hypothetical protein